MRWTLVLVVLLASGRARADVEETARIRAHLELARAQLGVGATGSRGAALATLDGYIARGEFPRRTNDGYAGRRPRFIDDRGVHCAVGHLIAVSGEPELARAIAERYEYAYVREIDDPRLGAWAKAHGFTVEELAMIQPSYDSPMVEGYVRNWLEAHKDQFLLQCAARGTPLSRVELHVVGSARGVEVAPKTKGVFARCVANHAASIKNDSLHRGARSFTFDIDLVFTDPQVLLQRMLDVVDVQQCTPRPGALSKTAAVAVATRITGMTMNVETTPANAEVAACIEQQVHRHVGQLAPLLNIAATRHVQLQPQVAFGMQASIVDYGRPAAQHCYGKAKPPRTININVWARRDDPDFAITFDYNDAAFAACVRKLMGPFLRTRYSVDHSRYFRIDADVDVSMPVQVGGR